MPLLQNMPQIIFPQADLQAFGLVWQANNQSLSRTPPNSSAQLGALVDTHVGNSLAVMLGNIPIITPSKNDLSPSQNDCVEVGPVRVVGGIRPQNFDVGYRPDGIRIAFDSKTLNDLNSVRKNYQNMINDLGTEATTVHARFPYAVVGFIILIPRPCLVSPQRENIKDTLERITERNSPLDSLHKAEVISLAVWDPLTGQIDQNWPPQNSNLRIEKFSDILSSIYAERYKGLPPHQ